MAMKTDRRIIEMAQSKLSLEQIATKLKMAPSTVLKIGRRLGIYFPPIEHQQNGRRTARR